MITKVINDLLFTSSGSFMMGSLTGSAAVASAILSPVWLPGAVMSVEGDGDLKYAGDTMVAMSMAAGGMLISLRITWRRWKYDQQCAIQTNSAP